MALGLRILLITASLFTVIYLLRKIRKSQIKTEDAIYWVIMPCILLFFSIFPSVAVRISEFVGIESTANMIFLCVIFLLLLKLFSVSIKVSQLEFKLSNLTQEVAIREMMNKKNIEKNTGKGNTDNKN